MKKVNPSKRVNRKTFFGTIFKFECLECLLCFVSWLVDPAVGVFLMFGCNLSIKPSYGGGGKGRRERKA